MAIQMRRGAIANLDKSKLVAGEVVVGTDVDKDYIGVAKAPSNVVQLATQDDLKNVKLNVDFYIDNDGHLIAEREQS